MDHLLEILKIVEGGLTADRGKVVAYARQLAGKLESAGEGDAAKRLNRALGVSNGKAKMDVVEPAYANGGARVPVDGESRFSLAEETYVERGEALVLLSASVEESVAEFLNYVKGADRLLAGGVDINPSLLVFGPPGCGKTELARYISSELDLPLITARVDTIVSSYLGSTAKNLRSLFEHAMARPCVLFLDELDAVAKLRDDPHELGELKRVVVSLLQNIDALDRKTVLLAATNHEHLLDSAIWRRFACKIKLDKPRKDVRAGLFEHFLSGFCNSSSNDVFAAISDGLSGADIKELCDSAKRRAILSGEPVIDAASLLRRVVAIRLAELAHSEMGLPESIKATRDLDPQVFTVRRLASVFGCSTGKVSKVLNQ